MKLYKKIIIPIIFLMGGVILILGILFSLKILMNDSKNNSNFLYSKEVLIDSIKTVVNVEDESIIVRPYSSENVKLAKGFYDYQSDANEQEESIILYENTYIQNTGVDYISDNKFEVLSINAGKVISISKDDLLGLVIKIEHENELISVYQSLSETYVKEGDVVSTGTKIGVSGESYINEDYNNYLHIEVYYDNKLLDPEKIYAKNIQDFN